MIQIGLHGGGRMRVALDRGGPEVDVSDVTPEVLAYGLSYVTRFGGQAGAYCPSPESRVLTDDLKWVAAGDLKVGQGLLGFDEDPVPRASGGGARRFWRPAKVVAHGLIRRPCIRLTLSDGTVLVASEEHPWLVSRSTSRALVWRTAAEVMTSPNAFRFPRYMHPWSERTDFASGWLSGIFDGEGHVGFTHRGVRLGVSQNEGLVLGRILELLSDAGCEYKIDGQKRCKKVRVVGGWAKQAELLGSFRPIRLLKYFLQALHAASWNKEMKAHQWEPLAVVSAERVGEQWVAGMETTTHTYICEGFGAHNSDAEHTVRMYDWAKAEGQDKAVLRAIMIHDAAECLGEGDTHRFVKLSFGDTGIKQFARLVTLALWAKFIPDERPISEWYWDRLKGTVKEYDGWNGTVEARTFGFPHEPLPEYVNVPVCAIPECRPWDAGFAQHSFLNRWESCQ